jgi:hypothetical protein
MFVETDKDMKTLVTILFAIITGVSYSQYPSGKYKNFSKIWDIKVVVENGVKGNVITPIGYKAFSLNMKYVKENINESEIEKYLLESFNEFRKNYNVSPVTQDVDITKGAEAYSKKLVNTVLVHDVNLPYGLCECIATIPYMMLSKITKEDGNLNKIIADSYFNIFVGSDSHMDILLDENIKTFGFGITVVDGLITVVVRGK